MITIFHLFRYLINGLGIIFVLCDNMFKLLYLTNLVYRYF